MSLYRAADRYVRNAICRRFTSSNTKLDYAETMEQQYALLKRQSGIVDGNFEPQRILIAHPKIRWGRNADFNENEELKLEEASALVHTLPGFSVARFAEFDFVFNLLSYCSCTIIGADYTVRKKLIWGIGRLENLKREQQRVGATAILVNIDILSPTQQVD